MSKFSLSKLITTAFGNEMAQRKIRRSARRRSMVEALELRELLSFNAIAPVGVGANPFSVAIADVNRDGKPDVLTANFNSSDVSVRLGDGAGGFSGSTNISVGTNPYSVAVADVNRDGKPDLLTANSGSNNVSVRLGDGTGGFNATNTISVGVRPFFVAIADVNGDGKPDLLAANFNSSDVSVRLGDGVGGFSGSTNIAVGASPYSVAIADVNRDGKPDLLTANASGNVSVRMGDGAGGFSGSTNISVGAFPKSLAIADVNGDGKPDFLTANLNSNDVSVRLGDGAGGFSGSTNIAVVANPESVAIADVNGDGKPDLLTTGSNSVSVRLGDGAGGFSGSTNIAAGGAVSVAVADVNGDGKPDLLTANFSSSNVSVLLNTYSTVTSLPFLAAASIGVGTNPVSAAISDVNGDGNPDVLIANLNSSNVSVRLGDGAGGFGGNTNISVGFGPQSVAVADVNGDGKPDFITANLASSDVSIRLGNGAGGFSGNTNISVGAVPTSVSIADVNGDGKPDLLTANETSNNVSVRLGDGAGGFSGSTNIAVGAGPRSVAVADVNGDGKPDLLTPNANGNNVSVRLGDGAGGFSGTTNIGVGLGPTSVAIADVNGDGKPDLITANESSNNVSVRLGDGAGGFSGSTNIAVGAGPRSVAVADVNGDGKPDLLTANVGSDDVSVRLGDGVGGFSGTTNIAVGADPWSLAIADVNRDGKPDLFTANVSSNNVSVILSAVNAAPPTLTIENVTAIEGSGLLFTVTLDHAVAGGFDVTVNVTDGTASSGTDYDATPVILHFLGNAGESKQFTVNTTAETTVEANETFSVSLTSSSPLVDDSETATGTIVNDDASVSIVATDASKPEGNSGTTPFTFTVTRTGLTNGIATVDYAVTGTTVNGANAADFGGSFSSGTVSFAANETSKTVTVLVSGDSVLESDEEFIVTLSNPSAGMRFETGGIPGLVGWFRGEGDASDAAGNNNGTLINGASFATGHLGQAFLLDGIDDAVSIPNDSTLNPTAAITVEAWINPTGHAGQYDPIVKKAGEGSQIEHGYSLEFDGNDVVFYVFIDGLGWQGSDRATIPLGTWSHVAGTYDGSKIRLFVNGSVIGAETDAPGILVPSGNLLMIGGDPSDPSRHFQGSIDDVRIHNRALNANELSQSLTDHATGVIINDDTSIAAYDVAGDFSLNANPNGPWSYGYITSLNGSLNVYTESSTSHYGNPNFQSWQGTETGDGNPNVFRNTASTNQTGAGANLDAGQLALHPGPSGSLSVVRWTAPNAATFSIRSVFEGRGIEGSGTTTDVHVLHNGVAIFNDAVNGFGLTSDASFSQILTVSAGDTIDFVVGFGSNGNFNGDTTGLTATIADTAFGSPPPAGNVGWWPGEENAFDVRGGNNGTLEGGTTFIPAEVGQGFQFDSDDDRVTIPDNVNVNIQSTGFTAGFWMRGDASQPEALFDLVDKSHGFVDFTGWTFQGDSGTGIVRFGVGSGSDFPEATGTGENLLDGQFHYVVGTWSPDDHTIRLFIDGVLRATDDLQTPVNNTRDLNIGYAWGGGSAQRFFRGTVDELQIFDRALSPAEILSYYTATSVQSLIVSPTSLSVTEGSTNTFGVKLAFQPAANVTVNVGFSSGDGDLSVSGGATLTFTTANWNTPQTVTLAAAEDVDLANGSAVFNVTSTGLTTVGVTATEADNDVQSLIVSQTSLSVAEGSTTTFTARLAFQPAGNVTVNVARFSGDTDLSVSGGATLTFTTANWNTPQTVTLAAAQDVDLTNGSAVFNVTSTGLTTVGVTATEADNDVQSLIVSPTSLSVTEGSTNTFTARLAFQPAGNVTVSVAFGSGDTDLSVSGGATLTFTTANWNTPQTVTLAAAEDVDLANGSAVFNVTSTGLTTVGVTATEADNDVQSLIVSPTSLSVPEGSTNTFGVKLAFQPAANVTVNLGFSSGDGDLTVSGSTSLTFTSSNWNTVQNFTLAAAEDVDLANGSAVFNVTSTGLTTVGVTATEADNDVQSLIVSPTALSVLEGSTNTFGVNLAFQPAANVTVNVAFSSGDADLAVSGSTSLTFTPANWNTVQNFTLAAAEDADLTNGSAVFSVTSTGLTTVGVTATEVDNDVQSLLVSSTAVSVTEGSTNTFTVRLSAQPTADVTVSVARFSGDTDLSVSGGATLTFTTANWNTPQTVTLAAAEDVDLANGSAVFNVTSTGLTTVGVTATEADNDVQSLIVSPTSLSVTEGSTNTFTARLAFQPAANVTVNVAFSSGDTDLSVSGGATLTFTTANWNTPQTVTLAAAEDVDLANGSAVFNVTSTGLTTVGVTATEADNDVQSLIVSPTSLSVLEGSTNTFTARLAFQPAGNVTVNVARISGDTDLSVSGGATLTFTTANWNTPQTVTLAAAEDVDLTNGSAVFNVTSTGLTTVGVTATEADNDVQSLIVSPTTLSVTEGSTNTFTARLAFQPAGNVTVNVARISGDTDLSVSGGATLTFTTTNWNTPQTVTLAAAEDVDLMNGSAVFNVTSTGLTTVGVTATEADNDVQSLIVSPTSLSVTEGSTNTFTARLAFQPAGIVTVNVARVSGDTDLSVSGGGALTFTTANWNTPQTVTLAAAEDADTVNGSAVFNVTSTGLSTVSVTGIEVDNDFAPTDILLSNNEIQENAGPNAAIGTLTATDANSGETFTFSLPTGFDDNAAFNISGTSLRANASFNFEVKSSYTVTVRVADSIGLTFDKTFTIAVTNVMELDAIDVQNGQTQRSFVQHLDLVFDSDMGLLDLINNGRLQLTKFDLNGVNGVVIPLPGGAGTSVSPNQINVDFGAQGIGGNRNSAVGDGFYEIGVDMDGNGSFETTKHFFRLFGDVTGDGTVNSADKIKVLQANGTTSAESDVNGDGVVNVLDTALMSRAIGKKIKSGLFWDD